MFGVVPRARPLASARILDTAPPTTGKELMGSVIKKRRKRMAKKKHRKLLRKTRHQRRNKK
jgi:hypothetical protein